MFRHILVPLDGSTDAESAIAPAAAMARNDGSLLHLVLVTGMARLESPVFAPREKELRRYASTRLSRIADGLHTELGVRVTMVRLAGALSVASALAEYISTACVDLVVMTTHGHVGWKRAWIGSVADELGHLVTTPLLLGRPPLEPDVVDYGFERILILLDGTPRAEAAIEPARAIGRHASSTVILGRVVPAITLEIVGGTAPSMVMPDPDATQAVANDARQYLDRIASGLRRRSGFAVETVVRVAPMLAEITSVAAAMAHDARADLVALTTHARGASRLLRGSVADRLLHDTHCAILLCHGAEPQPEKSATGIAAAHATAGA